MIYFYQTSEPSLLRLFVDKQNGVLVNTCSIDKEYNNTTFPIFRVSNYCCDNSLDQPWVYVKGVFHTKDLEIIKTALQSGSSRYYKSRYIQYSSTKDTYKVSDTLDTKNDKFYYSKYPIYSTELQKYLETDSIEGLATEIAREDIPYSGVMPTLAKADEEIIYAFIGEGELKFASTPVIGLRQEIHGVPGFSDFLGGMNSVNSDVFNEFLKLTLTPN